MADKTTTWSEEAVEMCVNSFFDKNNLIAWATDENLLQHPVVIARMNAIENHLVSIRHFV